MEFLCYLCIRPGRSCLSGRDYIAADFVMLHGLFHFGSRFILSLQGCQYLSMKVFIT